MKLLTTILLIICTSTFATDLKVENTIFYKEDGRAYASMDISWQNAFRLMRPGCFLNGSTTNEKDILPLKLHKMDTRLYPMEPNSLH